MISLQNASGMMSSFGDPSSPASGYFGGDYYEGFLQALQGNLSNEADPNQDTDAGYYLQWNYDTDVEDSIDQTLDPGESWEIVSFEQWEETHNQELSNNADLSVLTTQIHGDFEETFDVDTLFYTKEVDGNVSEITIVAVPEHEDAQIKVNGQEQPVTVPLNYWENIITIDVTAADGVTQKTYTLTVIRLLGIMGKHYNK
ncbi:cadherin-like beta sandwich domain-containing protein [Chengkuizengella axinellae]|uniref:Cadherin-like beta sandwich domain-containing protein n=1 Tax=Chengkuizengella axinellae TaxID=3064388 RepID=A0ABT9J150_9BACL|nr:cadherin-like beta sandwich domain-containing protein [Chengkuizengella sp. 2205SS18-9]MDP5275351.1 cadherin-like beta sandwich domain-containing protein [Chengkuizengella sp. 2205SS18-9]